MIVAKKTIISFKSFPLLVLVLCLHHAEARYKITPQTYLEYTEPDTLSKRPSPEAYNSLRNIFFRYEESKQLGSDIELTERELLANQIIMAAKLKEYKDGLVTPHLFNPSQHFFKVLDAIKGSQLFQYLSIMPKGAVLHAHDTALCSTDFLIDLTYRSNLWVCQNQGGLEAVALKFSKAKPTEIPEDQNCDWDLLANVRQQRGNEAVDKYLRERFTMYPTEKFLDNNFAWIQFMSIFGLLDGLLTYAPVWGDYYYNALKEFRADGVQYLEFRTTLPVVSNRFEYSL